MRITTKQLTIIRKHAAVAEASDLDFPVSVRNWPTEIVVKRTRFKAVDARFPEGEGENFVHYRTQCGRATITIFND